MAIASQVQGSQSSIEIGATMGQIEDDEHLAHFVQDLAPAAEPRDSFKPACLAMLAAYLIVQFF